MSAMILVVVAVVAGLWAAGKLLRTGGWWTIVGWKYRALGWALTLAALVVLALLVWAAPWWVQLLAVPVLVWLVARPVLRRARSSSVIGRWADRARRTHGVATSLDVARISSAWAVKRKARHVRPALGELGWVARMRVPPREVGVRLARVGAQDLWASLEDVITVVGGPRTGKTGWLGGAIIDAPGAVVSTSTRLDLMHATRSLRGPVHVFNPAGLGGEPNTVAFDPLSGCTDPVIATERAHDMLPETEGSGDRAHWDAQARRVLAMLLHAAALDRATMRDVLAWVADPTEQAKRIYQALAGSPEPSFVPAIEQFLTLNDRTQTSITSAIMAALAWVTDSTAYATTWQGTRLDVADLLARRGAVYLLGRHEAHTAPLLAALTGHIAREARRIAASMPGGRLDPPLTLALDEAARVAPVPLPDWTGDMGGSGTCIILVLQSRADLVDRWGRTGAAKILNNSGTIMLFGGTKDHDDLRAWAELAGDREEHIASTDARGRVTARSTRRTQVLPPAQLANLPTGRVVIFRRGMAPAIGRPRMSWQRRDIRRARPAAQPAIAPVGRVTHPHPTQETADA